VSVFVDIAPDESQVDSPAATAPSGKWRGRLTRATLPLLSVVVFFVVWQIAAVSGIWNQTFVPHPGTLARLRWLPPPTGFRLRRYLLWDTST
jgi:taurine transport system permease protein